MTVDTVAGQARIDPGEVYLVLARAEKGQPLAQIGLVKAASPGLAFIYARQQYTERRWDELCVVPKRALFTVAATTRERGLTVPTEAAP